MAYYLCYHKLEKLLQMEKKKKQKSWFVYILECADRTYYTGITTDIKKRIKTHNSGKGAKYTKMRIPVELTYLENHENRSTATKRELEIKKLSREQKETLIKNFILLHNYPH